MRRSVDRYAILVALLLECLILAFATDGFLTTNNIANVLRQNAFTAVLAAGMTFVIVAGAIDLSVGSIVGLTGVMCADIMARGHGVVSGVSVGLLTGVLIGGVNGLVVTKLRVPAFVVTLAMMLIARGAAFKYTDARTITGLPASFELLSSGARRSPDHGGGVSRLVGCPHAHGVRATRVRRRRQRGCRLFVRHSSGSRSAARVCHFRRVRRNSGRPGHGALECRVSPSG